MRAILINPISRTVTEIDVTNGLDSPAGLYAHMRANDPAFSGMVEGVGISSSPRLDLYVDEEGNLEPGRLVWDFNGQKFTGPGILTATDEEGDIADCNIPAYRVAKVISWTNLESTGDFGPSRESVEYSPIFQAEVPTFHGGQPIFREKETES